MSIHIADDAAYKTATMRRWHAKSPTYEPTSGIATACGRRMRANGPMILLRDIGDVDAEDMCAVCLRSLALAQGETL